MSGVSPEFLTTLATIVGDENIITKGGRLKRNSQDAYWYSPVLKKQLADKSADVIVEPATQEQLVQVIAAAVRERVPIVPRGAGTGNYGQSVPIFGGVLISIKKLNRMRELTPEFATVEAGVILLDIETSARKSGQSYAFSPARCLHLQSLVSLLGGRPGQDR